MSKPATVYGKHGYFVRVAYLVISAVYRMLSVIFGWHRNEILVLCYHGVDASRREAFHFQMRWISGRATLADAKYGNPYGHQKLPRIAVTFDDAFQNLLLNAVPSLNEFRIPAVVFAVASNLGDMPRWDISPSHPEAGEKTMTAEQLAALSKNPLVVIGSHTSTHPDLTAIDPKDAREELVASKQCLERILGYTVDSLALPHGAGNESVFSLAREAGYSRIYTLSPEPVRSVSDDPRTGRFSMSPDVWKAEFRLTCAGAYSWLSGWRTFLRRLKQKPTAG